MGQPLTHDSVKRATSLIRKIELPWLILAALLISTLVAAFQSSRQLRADADARFAEIAQGEKRTFIRRLREIESLLYSARAFQKVVPNLSQSAWDTYLAASIRDGGTRPGVVAIQFVPDAAGANAPVPITSLLTPSVPADKVPLWNNSRPLLDAISSASSTNLLVMSLPLNLPAGNSSSPDWVAMVLPLSINTAPPPPRRATPRSIGSVVAIVDLAGVGLSLARIRLFQSCMKFLMARSVSSHRVMLTLGSVSVK